MAPSADSSSFLPLLASTPEERKIKRGKTQKQKKPSNQN
jgi:hypothetical protein